MAFDLRAAAAPVELVRAARSAWPAGRPLAARIDPDGEDEGVRLARALVEAGCDLVDLSARPPADRQARFAHTSLSERIRLEAGVATIVSGAGATDADLDAALAAGRADLCRVGERSHD